MRARKKGDGSFRKLKTGQIELTISDGYDISEKITLPILRLYGIRMP